jgi:LysR family transcriptional activator of nhaA
MLLPGENSAMRRSLDFWLESYGVHPAVAGEFQDYALLRAFGQVGRGVFPMPSVLAEQVLKQDSLQTIGLTEDVRNCFYAITVERKLKHPAVIAICDTARKQLFGKRLLSSD